MTKIFKILDYEIHDHYILVGVFLFFIGITYFNEDHNNKNNCYILEPDITCNYIGTISRSSIINNSTTQWVFTSANFTAYHVDEFRQKNGYAHVECGAGNNTCSIHYDVYNGVIGPYNVFGMIGHTAETVDRICPSNFLSQGLNPDIYGCQGLPDWITVIILWAFLVFVPYYVIKYFLIPIVWRGGKRKR